MDMLTEMCKTDWKEPNLTFILNLNFIFLDWKSIKFNMFFAKQFAKDCTSSDIKMFRLVGVEFPTKQWELFLTLFYFI